jgi:hypothetical protein
LPKIPRKSGRDAARNSGKNSTTHSRGSDGAGHLKIFRELAAKKGFQVIQTEFFDSTAQTIGNIGREPALVAALFAANDVISIRKA